MKGGEETTGGEGGAAGDKCFICWKDSESVKGVPAALKLDKKRLSPLNEQLSVVLLLRKILGIRQEVVTKLIATSGDPSLWGIKVCRSCSTLFREAEFIHRRLVKFHADFEELAKEVRTLLVGSGEEEEIEAGNEEQQEGRSLVEIGRRRKKVGRPKKRRVGEPRAEVEEEATLMTISNPVLELRRKFLEDSRKKALDILPLQTLSTTRETGTLLDGILTTQPVAIKVSEEFVNNRKYRCAQEFGEGSCLDVGEGTAAGVRSVNKALSKGKTFKITVKAKPDEKTEETCNDPNNAEKIDATVGEPSDVCYLRSLPVKSEVSNGVEEAAAVDNDDLADLEFGRDLSALSPEWTPGDDHCEEVAGENVNEDEDYEVAPRKRGRPCKIGKVHAQRKKASMDMDTEPIHENDSYNCPKCDKFFDRKLDCRAHILRDHFGDPLPFHCHVGDVKGFATEKYLRRHMNRFHVGAKTPYDEDYDPDLHSAEKLKSMVMENDTWKLLKSNDNESEDDEDNLGDSINPEIPEEVLKKFRNEENKIYRCRVCKRKFRSEMVRDGHEKRIHEGISNPFSCDKCHRKFEKPCRLLQHMVVVHFSSQPCCPQCGLRFADKMLLEGHIRRVHLGETNPFECKTCSKLFPKRAKLNDHMIRAHGLRIPTYSRKKIAVNKIKVPKAFAWKKSDDDEVLECWICTTNGQPLKFNTAEEKDEHIQRTHTKVPERYTCPATNCNKTYLIYGKLEKHIAVAHNAEADVPPPQSEFKCLQCDKTFKNRGVLNTHLTTHDAQFVCDLCGNRYKMRTYLRDHQLRCHHKELGIQPHKCNFCGKVLNNAKVLDHHIKSKHTKETKYKCKECDFGCMYKALLQRHVEVRHLKISKALCDICSRPFATQWYLEQHILRVHSGQKPHKCKECGKEFSDPPTYNRHVEAHAGRVHQCPLEFCKKQYNTRHAFRVHLKLHQKKGIMVEIPEFTYNSKEDGESNGGSTEAQPADDARDTVTDIIISDPAMPPLAKELLTNPESCSLLSPPEASNEPHGLDDFADPPAPELKAIASF